jgi:hypothetical protein
MVGRWRRCRVCRAIFKWSIIEQQIDAAKGIRTMPRRCHWCRKEVAQLRVQK